MVPVTMADEQRLVPLLRSSVRGQTSDDPGTRALYATDASNYRLVPDVVVFPADVEDLAIAATVAADAGAPVTVRGGGTSIAGNAIGGVVIDASRHVNHIIDLDPDARTAVVEPGVVLTDLTAAAAPHGLTFGADPSSGSRATLGGMIANNACGAHSVAWGTTADNLRSLDVVLATGERMTLEVPGRRADPVRRRTELAAQPGREGAIYRALGELVDANELMIRRRFGQFSRQISGYALQRLLPEAGYDVARLLCGSEGTLATTLRATVALTPLPAARVLLALGFRDPTMAADCVPTVLPHGPLTMESINATLLDRLPDQVRKRAQAAGLPDGQAWLLVEVGGSDADGAAEAGRRIAADLHDCGVELTSSLVSDPGAQGVLWRCRRDSAGLATRRSDGGEAWGGWEDAAVPPEHLGEYLRRLDELLARYQLTGSSYGHFGEGCMHMRMDFDLFSAEGIARYRSFVTEATDLVVSLGGSVSGEHGDGRARSELLRTMYGADAADVFAQVKRVWDPAGVMNPNVIVAPDAIDDHLRHNG
ncbi:MAG: FAD-binding oxidoreductase, partial [Nocardioidaceae bacterium]